MLDTDNSTTENQSAAIIADDTVTVELTNAYVEAKGSLIVSKTISGTALNSLETISFSVKGNKGTTVIIPDLTTANVENGTWTDEGNGKYTYTVKDLSAGEKFTVKETLDGHTKDYVLDSDNSTTENESAAIKAGESVTVELTNAYKEVEKVGSLIVSKTISGTALNNLETISFSVNGNKGTAVTVPDLTTANVENGTWTDAGNGKYTYTVENLPAGEKFTESVSSNQGK